MRSEAGRKARLERLRALVEGQTGGEFSAIRAEIAELEALAPPEREPDPEPKPRKAKTTPNRKRTGGMNRSE